MFCPECGNQNPDNAKFCVSCGMHYSQTTGGAGNPIARQVVGSTTKKSPNYLWFIGGGLVLLIIAGLVSVMLYRNSTASSETGPTPRVKNGPNTTIPAPSQPPLTNNASNAVSPPSNANLSTPSPTIAASTPKPTPQPTVKVVKQKPVDCDKKCYNVYDQCMADYRQFADPETICRGRQTTCLSKCG